MIFLFEMKKRMTREELFAWAKTNRKKLTREFFAKNPILPSNERVAIFMAWSPWAGKTEFVNRLLTKEQQSAYYILDLDKIRGDMPGYKGNYASEYTSWAIKILEMLIDTCVEQSYNFILDGTFTSTAVIDKNIERLISHGYAIQVFYIHTQPYLAWAYTFLRDSDDKRRIPVEQFIEYYFRARENVRFALQKFGANVSVSIVQKVRDEKQNVVLDECIYQPASYEEMDEVFQSHIAFYPELWKNGVDEWLFFHIIRLISIIPFIWKSIIRHMPYLPKQK